MTTREHPHGHASQVFMMSQTTSYIQCQSYVSHQQRTVSTFPGEQQQKRGGVYSYPHQFSSFLVQEEQLRLSLGHEGGRDMQFTYTIQCLQY